MRRLRTLISDTESESDDDYLPSPRRLRLTDEPVDYFEDYDDQDFSTRFRMSKASALYLLSKIQNSLEYKSDRNCPISPINQLLATLRFYATNNTQKSVGDHCGMSTSTSHRIIHQVSEAIASLNKEFFKFPESKLEIKQEQDNFFKIARFPRVVGAMDCQHVRITSTGVHNAEHFRNKKGYLSVNVQTICNTNLEITDIVARWPGSSLNSTIFSKSYVRLKFELGKYGNALLLVGRGYPSDPYLMAPLENPSTPAEQLYNESQIKSRQPGQRLYGIWARRFPVLCLGMRIELDKALVVIVATAVLHNMLRKRGDGMPLDDPELVLPVPWDQLIELGKMDSIPSARDELISYFQYLV